MTKRLILINFCAFCLLLCSGKLVAKSNLQITDSLVNVLTLDVLNKAESKIKKNIVLQIGDLKGNLENYLKTKIGNILNENNYQVFRNFPKDTSFDFTVLDIQNCILQISYSEPFSESYFENDSVQRKIQFKLNGQVYNGENSEVVIPVVYEKKYEDRLKFNDIEKVEESPYQFTIGQKTGLNAWQNTFEPIIVISSVLTVILLLFTQRS